MDELTGDFIERHAKAASLYNKITVLFVVRDDSVSKPEIEVRKYNENCTAHILYYRSNLLLKYVHYFFFFLKLIGRHFKTEGRPALVHVHVCFRAGLLGLYCRWRYHIPYFITEHWSLFNDAAPRNFGNISVLRRWLIRLIYRKARGVSAVSLQLAHSIMEKTGVMVFPKCIPNVFDSSLFYPQEKGNDVFRFIHVSQLNYAKNPEQIADAVTILSRRSSRPFEFTIYGPAEKHFNHPNIVYRSEVPQSVLATAMRQHDALVLYSRYEGLPCVAIEALACGLPVIGSDIPPMREILNENNGIIVELDNPELLAQKMLELMNHIERFNKNQIASNARNLYSFSIVGRYFDSFYSQC